MPHTLRVLAVMAAALLMASPGWAGKKKPGGGGSGPHAKLTWQGPDMCLKCHQSEANDVFASAHYQWEGDAKYMLDGPARQGKLRTALNAYCVSILGNFSNALGVPACGNCHVGRGAPPESRATRTQLENIDCLVCHQENYKRVKVNGVFVPDAANMTITMDQAVQTVHAPTRATCLQCHGRSGGGDNYKRGDLAMAHASTSDRGFDVHMSTSGGNLDCLDCHATSRHRIAGRGADLRQTDLDVELSCSDSRCHAGKSTGGHGTAAVNSHVARVACQTCHIPRFARNAGTTAASEATEMFRDWRASTFNAATRAYHPHSELRNDVVPVYAFWDKYNWNYNYGQPAPLDQATQAYSTSRPHGDIADREPTTKLYPFKYKTSAQPITNGDVLVALDTSVYFKTGDYAQSVNAGLKNMGLPGAPWSTVAVDVMQLITHEVAPRDRALACSSCHGASATQMSLPALGYTLKGDPSLLCVQCHEREDEQKDFYGLHREHVTEKQIDCSMCHSFSRPERGLRVGIVRDDD